MRVHFIAIGGSAMHNLAIALHKKGFEVTGSDDEIFEPSKSRLDKYNLLPEKEGWYEQNITNDIDAVILGMHARPDNLELKKAQELGLKIYSYPEYIYEQTKDKKRVVIGGSHGKTSITAMILHVLHYHKINCDYMVGAQLEGFDTMVKLTDEAKLVILEGDEYLSSPIDRRPKFHLYKADVGLVSGIAWDHINVFPTFENYLDQFRFFVNELPNDGIFIYCSLDENLKNIALETDSNAKQLPYGIPKNEIKNGTTFLKTPEGEIPLKIFGDHNLQNLAGAGLVCHELGMSYEQFYEAIQSFTGASKRLELIAKNDKTAIYKDFAHSPSKLKATINAVKNQYPERKLVACMELHTFSSLTQEFLKEYEGAMDAADYPIVYFNPETIKHKKLPEISKSQIKSAFGNEHIAVYTNSNQLTAILSEEKWEAKNLLLMSSGNFDGVNLNAFGKSLVDV